MTTASTVTGVATVVTDRIYFDTKGNADMVNLTAEVRRFVKATGLADGCRHRLRSRGYRSGHHARVRAGSRPGLRRTSSTGSSPPPSTTSTTSPTPT